MLLTKMLNLYCYSSATPIENRAVLYCTLVSRCTKSLNFYIILKILKDLKNLGGIILSKIHILEIFLKISTSYIFNKF